MIPIPVGYRRDGAGIVLVGCDCSPHIPSRVTADAFTGSSVCVTDADLSRCEFLSEKSTPFKGTCCSPERISGLHPRFRASQTFREGSPGEFLSRDRTTGWNGWFISLSSFMEMIEVETM